MPQAVDCELLLYADNTCLIFQHKDITEIEITLHKNCSMLCDWFVNNKLSIHVGEAKTKSILFGSKHKNKNLKPLSIQYNDMAIQVTNKINSRLRFLYHQYRFLNAPLCRLLLNVPTFH